MAPRFEMTNSRGKPVKFTLQATTLDSHGTLRERKRERERERERKIDPPQKYPPKEREGGREGGFTPKAKGLNTNGPFVFLYLYTW